MYRSTSIWDDLKREFQQGNIITRLIFANVAVFLLLNFLQLVFTVFVGQPEWSTLVNRQFMLPADPGKFITRPWTLITHMFAHKGLFHILFNMLWLYWMGKILAEYLGQRKLLPIYLLGGIAGGLFYMLLFNVLPYFAPSLPSAEALGASAGVMAIVVATATLLPDFRIHLLFLGAVKLKWIAVVAVVLDVLGVGGGNAGGSIAHLGGAGMGYLFIRQLQAGSDWSKGINQLLDTITGWFSRTKGPRIHYTNTKKAKSTNKRYKRRPPQHQDPDKQQRLDEILDKISRSGYDGLTKEEKDFLFHFSKDN